MAQNNPQNEAGLIILTLTLFAFCIWVLWRVYV